MGVRYVTASGARIKIEGEKQIKIKTKTGDVRQMAFQVAKVTKPLCSVSKIRDKGHTVVFGERALHQAQKDGRDYPTKEHGVYAMDAAIMGQASWMYDDGQQLASAEEQQVHGGKGFHRHAKTQL